MKRQAQIILNITFAATTTLLLASCEGPVPVQVTSSSIQGFAYEGASRLAMNALGYRVYAHWHSYHWTQYNRATGKDEFAELLKPISTIWGDDREYLMGGLHRDRPFFRPVPPPASAFQDEAKLDVQLAAAIGIDGFFVNVHFLDVDDGRWNDNVKTLFDQADAFSASNNPGFGAAINIDGVAVKGYADYASTANIHALAGKIASFKNRASYLKMNNRFILGAALPEQVPASYWLTLVSTLEKEYDMPIAFVPCYNTYPAGYQDSLKSITAASNGWRMYHHTASTMAVSSWNSANGVPLIATVTSQDNRPKAYQTTETAGFKSQYKSWEAAINNDVKSVMILTWNDYSEGHHLRPSTALQYAMYDLAGFYATWFKTRVKPAVTKDVIFYAHRMHRSDVTVTKQPQKVTSSVPDEAPLLDNVYALAFLKSPGQIQIINGDGKMYYSGVLPAGVQFFEAPLVANATPVVRIVSPDKTDVRSEITSAFHVRAGPLQWEDYLYRAGGSNRPVVEGVQNSIPEDRL